MRDMWEKMEPFPLASIDYCLTLVKLRQDERRAQPYVLLLLREGKPEVMLIGRTEDVPHHITIGGKRILTIKLRSLRIGIGGLVGNLSHANCVTLLSTLMASLKKGQADIAYFSEITTALSIFQLARTMPNILCRDYFPDIDLHYRMTLPDSIDDFYKARKKRKHLKRIMRRLDEDFSGNSVVTCFREPQKVEQFCHDAEEISKKTYQYAFGGGFVHSFADDRERSALLTLLAEHGWLLAYILYIEGKPCAFEGGIVYNGIYYSDYCGYDYEYSAYEPGTILQIHIIDELCQDNEVEYIDFGWMDVAYKRRFCDLKWEEASFRIFRPAFKGVMLNTIRVLLYGGQRLTNKILTVLRLEEHWKRFRRNRALSRLN